MKLEIGPLPASISWIRPYGFVVAVTVPESNVMLVVPPVEKSPNPAGPPLLVGGYQSIRPALTTTPPFVTFAIDKAPVGAAAAVEIRATADIAIAEKLEVKLIHPPKETRSIIRAGCLGCSPDCN